MHEEPDHHQEAERHRRAGDEIAKRLAKAPSDASLIRAADYHSAARTLHEFHAKKAMIDALNKRMQA